MPDLVIGSRRSGPLRPWRAGGIALAILGVAVLVSWFIYRRSVAYEEPGGELRGDVTAAGDRLVYGDSSLAWRGGIPVLRARGDAYAIGAAHGRLLAPLIAPVLAAADASVQATVSDDGLFPDATHHMRLAWRWRFVDDGMLEADRRAIAGLARGAAASGTPVAFDDALRDQAVLDLGAPSPASGEADAHVVVHTLTIVAKQAQLTGHLWIGRAVSLSGLGDGGVSALPVVTIAHPEGRFAWASVGWPGELGAITGVNTYGVAVMVDPARTNDVRATRSARPIALLARSVLEQASTLDEAIKLVEATPTLGAGLFVLAEGATGTWAIVERTPSKAIVERAPKSAAYGDTLTTNALASDPDNERAHRSLASVARVDRAARLAHEPLLDAGAMAAILRDTRGSDDKPRPPGHRGAIDDGRETQVAILDPSTLALWVADPRAEGHMRAFDLRAELRESADADHTPAPVDLPAAGDPDLAADLAAARAELRTARLALARGDRDAAAEACARARVRAPELPEALELEAIIAHARGDDARARTLYQQWLDGGPDDPPGEDRARALLSR